MSERFKLDFSPGEDGQTRALFKDKDGYLCRIKGCCPCANRSVAVGLVSPRDFGMMSLSRDMARELGRALTGFAETGKPGKCGEDASQILQRSNAERQFRINFSQAVAEDNESLCAASRSGANCELTEYGLARLTDIVPHIPIGFAPFVISVRRQVSLSFTSRMVRVAWSMTVTWTILTGGAAGRSSARPRRADA